MSLLRGAEYQRYCFYNANFLSIKLTEMLQYRYLQVLFFCFFFPIRLKWTLNLNALTSYDLNLSEKDHLVTRTINLFIFCSLKVLCL